MTFIVVTRLRLRDPALFDEFFAAAVAVVEQAQSSEGNLAAEVLGEANNTYWTRTGWDDEAAMRRFMVATFVNWHQSDARLPEWDAAYERLIADGVVVDLPHASVDNAARAFPPPAFSE